MTEILDTGDGRGKLGPFLAAMLVATGMIGSGVYLLPTSLAAFGSVSILGWIGAIVGATLLAGVFSGLAAVEPGGHGMFDHIGRAFGPGVGFVVGLLYWIPVSNLPLALAVTGYLSVFFPQLASGAGSTVATVVVLWLAIGVNIVSPRFVARLGGWTLLIGIAPILLIAIGGWAAFHPAIFASSWNVSGHSALTAVPRTVTLIFWAFIGIENALIVAPLIRDPARNVALATFGGLALASVLYLAACGAIMGMIPAADLARSSAPFADAGRVLLGATMAGAVALCAMLKAGGTLAGTVLITVETAESEAVLGQVLPRRQPRRADRPPKLNLILLGVLLSLLTVASTSPTLGRQFAVWADISVVLNLLTYLAASLALLRFCGWGAQPGRRRLAAVAVAGALFCCAAIAASEADLLAWTLGAIAIAALLWLAVRMRGARAAA